MNKKVSDLSRDELYEKFKEGITDTVRKHFNGPSENLLEPAVFLALKKDAIEKAAKKHSDVDEQMKYHKAIRPDGYEDYAIHTALIPLGPFFEDHGHPIMNDFAKKAAMKLIQLAIKDFTKDDMTAVMFSCFVSECYMAKGEGDSNTAASLHLGDTDVIEDAMKGYDRVKDMPNAEEKVIMLFETSQTTEMVQFDILNEDGFKMMTKEKSLGKTAAPGQGAIAGILHKPSTAFTAN